MTSTSAPPPRTFAKRLVRPLLIAVGGYLGIVVMFAALQRSLMYPAMRSGPLPAAGHPIAGVKMTDVAVTTSDGLTLQGWHAVPAGGDSPVPTERRPVILFLHGNGGNRVHRLDDVDLLTGAGAEVLLFDYRGYAENLGSPSEDGFAKDARAIWNFATQDLEIAADRIVLFGESLGGGVAVRLAAEQCNAGTPPGGLILRSTFSSMTDAASHHYPWLPVRLTLLDRYDSLSRIKTVTCPVLSLHGDADEIVPEALGRRLFDAAPARSAGGVAKRFAELSGAGHNDVTYAAAGAYRAAVTTFLREIFAPKRAAR